MQTDVEELPLFEEKRLIATLLTGKPSSGAFFAASVTVVLMAFLTLFFWSGPESLAELMPAAKEKVFFQGQIWRVFTAMFAHADLKHFLSNMYMLWIFSFLVFGYFGSLIFPLVSFTLGALVNALAILTYPMQTTLIGASGLVYLLGGFWLASYLLIQRQYTVFNRFLRVTGIALVIFAPSTFIISTSYRTHAIGFFVGALAATFYFIRNKEKIRSYEVYKITLV
jgi:rhomboid protease GluP